MPIITPDLSQSGPIKPGTYRAKIIACEAKTSKNGNPMIVPDFEIDTGDETPRSRKAYIVTSGAGARPFGQLLRATGFSDLADIYMGDSLSKPPFDTDDLVGQELMLQVEAETYNGEPSDKIAGYMKL